MGQLARARGALEGRGSRDGEWVEDGIGQFE